MQEKRGNVLDLLAKDNERRNKKARRQAVYLRILQGGHPYGEVGGRIVRFRMTRIGEAPEPLCNFTARIVAEEVRDDGAERRLVFHIEGRLAGGEELSRVAVPAERFAGMSWVTEAWGSRAVVNAGQGAKDHLRAAIQHLSGHVQRREVFAHLGWRRLGGRWVFLHAGGAIGPEGAVADVECDPGELLAEYRLPAPPEGERLREAVRTSLRLLDAAPATVAWPLLAAVYRAPLCEVLPADFSLQLTGPTGAGKSTLAAIAQAHYGAGFDRLHLPAAWSSTANALERVAFLAKDALLVVDDFAPRGSGRDAEALHRDADRLLRGAGNRQGRQRLQADGTLRPAYYPRGLIVSTGEDIPAGQSLRARLLVVEVEPGAVNWAVVSETQELANDGALAKAMAGYLRWLASRLDAQRAELRERHRALREKARWCVAGHPRMPDAAANLALGAETFLRFAIEAGVVDRAERLWQQAWQALLAVAAAQEAHQRAEDPVVRFFALLSAALASGQAHVADAATGGEPVDSAVWGWRDGYPQGLRVGWLRDGELLLEPDVAFAVAQRLARDQGGALPISPRTLLKRMGERGLLLAREDEHLRVKRAVAGVVKRVVVVAPSLVRTGETGETGEAGEAGHEALGAQGFAAPAPLPGRPFEPGSGGGKTGEIAAGSPVASGLLPGPEAEPGGWGEAGNACGSQLSGSCSPDSPVSPDSAGEGEQDFSRATIEPHGSAGGVDEEEGDEEWTG